MCVCVCVPACDWAVLCITRLLIQRAYFSRGMDWIRLVVSIRLNDYWLSLSEIWRRWRGANGESGSWFRVERTVISSVRSSNNIDWLTLINRVWLEATISNSNKNIDRTELERNASISKNLDTFLIASCIFFQNYFYDYVWFFYWPWFWILNDCLFACLPVCWLFPGLSDCRDVVLPIPQEEVQPRRRWVDCYAFII